VAGSVLDDLRAELDALDGLLMSLGADQWQLATPAEGWTVADTVRHLLVAERAATRSVRDGVDFVGHGRDVAGAAAAAAASEPDDGAELLDAWRAASTATVDALRSRGEDERVPWGGREMSVRSLATARLMETWAHGLDCFAAAGAEPLDTDRLVHVAWLGHRTLPYAFGVAGEQPPAPPAELRVELVAPSGAPWAFGPEGSPHRVEGPASTWCRVVTRRLRAPSPGDLRATGPLAAASLRVAQAYLDL
jgi:uncharacterized protein (TIGR03084 family)